jgi:hypothetical protein
MTKNTVAVGRTQEAETGLAQNFRASRIIEISEITGAGFRTYISKVFLLFLTYSPLLGVKVFIGAFSLLAH